MRTFAGTGYEEIWRYRVPFRAWHDGYIMGYPGDDHDDIDDEGFEDRPWGDEQGHVIFHPEHGEITALPQENGRTPKWLTHEYLEQIKDDARARFEDLGPYPDPNEQYRTANIFDPIQRSLDQRVFNGIKPRPYIAHYIEQTFMRTLSDLYVENPDQYFDLALTGSLTTFQYSESSDCDISVFVHYDELMDELDVDEPGEIRKELIHLVTTNLDGTIVPGTQHPLQFFIIPPGNTINDYFKPGMRSGWSFDEQGWIVPPEKKRSHDISSEMPELYTRASMMAEKMKTLLDMHDLDGAREFFAAIHKKRNEDEQAGLGDFSEGNIVYKFLLHEGLFDRLRNEAGVRIAKTSHQTFYIGTSGEVDLNRPLWATPSQALAQLNAGSTGNITGFQISPNATWAMEDTLPGGTSLDSIGWQPEVIEKLKNNKVDVIKGSTGEQIFVVNPRIITKTSSERHPIYYDFDRDRIGTHEDFTFQRGSKIIGEYDGKDAYLHGVSRQWINPNYFKRLWVATFPERPLNKVHMDGAAIETRPADEMTYTQKLPWLVQSSEYDVPIENPINYTFAPIAPQELQSWVNDTDKGIRDKYRYRAMHLNQRAKQLGNEGRVNGQELWALNNRYQGNCAYCNQPGADSWDHVIPLKNNGTNTIDNLLPVHTNCNYDMNNWDQSLTPTQGQINSSPDWYNYKATHIASDPWRKGKEWKDFIKNEGIIVDFQVGDPKDEPVEGRVKEINKDSIRIEVDPGEFRTFDDDFLRQIKFRVRDDKHSLSHWKESSVVLSRVGDCPSPDCDYEFSDSDRADVSLAHGWFTCPQCNRSHYVYIHKDHHKTSYVS